MLFTNVKKYILTLTRIQEIHGLLCKSSLNSKLSFLKFYLNSCYQNKELNCFNNWTEKVNSIGLELTNESRNWTIGITSNSKENSEAIYLNNDFETVLVYPASWDKFKRIKEWPLNCKHFPPGKSIIFDFSTSLTHLELMIFFKPVIIVTINT